MDLFSREQEFQHRAYAARPACFVVGAAVDLLEVQRLAGTPVIGFEAPIEVLHVVQGAAPFVVAHIESHAGAVPDFGGALVEVAEDAFVVPPDAGGKHGEFAKPGGIAEA